MDKLTERQSLFVLNYIKSGYNAYNAGIASGYSEQYSRTNASKLLNHPIIFEHILKAHQRSEMEKMEELKCAASDMAVKLLRIIDDIMPEEGEIKRTHYRHALAAIDMLNKMRGSYAPAKSFTVNVETTHKRLKDARQAYDEY
jgi:phage terminase small subunit